MEVPIVSLAPKGPKPPVKTADGRVRSGRREIGSEILRRCILRFGALHLATLEMAWRVKLTFPAIDRIVRPIHREFLCWTKVCGPKSK